MVLFVLSKGHQDEGNKFSKIFLMASDAKRQNYSTGFSQSTVSHEA